MSRLKGIYSIFNLHRKQISAARNLQIGIRCVSSKEIGFAKSMPSNDFLLRNIKSASTTEEILDIVSSYNKVMNSKHIVQSLKVLFQLQKSQEPKISNEDIMNDSSFRMLCISLKSQIRSIDVHEAVEALKVLAYMGVPSKSTILQSLLQIVRYNVNHLSLQQIIFLNFILKQMKMTPLSEALLIALPIVLEINLPLKIARDNVSQLTDLLQFVSRKDVSESTVTLLTNVIMENKKISPHEAVSVVWSLCDLKPNRYIYEPVLKRMLNIIVHEGTDLKMPELETTLTKLSTRYNKTQEFYYHEQFYNMIADYVINKNIGLQQALWILQKFNKVEHLHHGLLDYIIENCESNPNIFTSGNIKNLYAAVGGFSLCRYMPQNFDRLRCLIKNQLNEMDFSNQKYLKFAAKLAVLDIFNESLLTAVFSEENITDLSERGSKEDFEHFMVLYQCIKTLQPQYLHTLSVKTNDIINRSQDVNMEYPLEGSLEVGCGGNTYVQTGLRTKLGHHIHHAIIMRKGGFPVALNNPTGTEYIENLHIPINSHIIVIMGCDSTYFDINNYHVKGIKSLMMNTLEALGYSVIPIAIDRWLSIPDHEKIPYLMREIKLKNEEFEKMISIQ